MSTAITTIPSITARATPPSRRHRARADQTPTASVATARAITAWGNQPSTNETWAAAPTTRRSSRCSRTLPLRPRAPCDRPIYDSEAAPARQAAPRALSVVIPRRTPKPPAGAQSSAPAVETPAGLLAELARHHLLPQQRRRLEPGTERGGEVLGDGQADVEADEVGEPQRPHGMAVPEDHALVDVRRAGHALLQHADRLQAEGHAEAAGGEAGRVADLDALLAQA